MFDGNRLYRFAIGGWLLAAVFSPCFAEALQPTNQGGNTKPAQTNTEQPQKTPTPKQEVPIEVVPATKPVGSGSTNLSGTKNTPNNIDPEKQRAQKDLEAQQKMALWAFWMFAAAISSVVVAAVAVWLVYLTLREAQNTTKAAAGAAKAAAETVGAMQRAERAYVKMSHITPDDSLALTFVDDLAHFKIEVRNHGRTPATVTAIHVQLDRFSPSNPIPVRPVYKDAPSLRKFGAFLVANDSVKFSTGLPVPPGGDGQLWLYGYVDYIDEFKARHRGGYARYYRETTLFDGLAVDDRNNLLFVNKKGWNYDETRPPENEKDKAD